MGGEPKQLSGAILEFAGASPEHVASTDVIVRAER
jgi:hypothetical protein